MDTYGYDTSVTNFLKDTNHIFETREVNSLYDIDLTNKSYAHIKNNVVLSEGEITFIKDKVLNMNGSMDDFNLNYKIDCILSDKEEEFVSSIENKIKVTLRDFCPDSILEVDEWYSFTTNAEEGQEIEFADNKMLVEITNTYTTYTESND